MLPCRKEHIRDFNSKLLLEMIICKGPISRAALAKETGLTKATVSAIVQELLQSRLILEIGSEDTTLGRKPILLSFQHKSGYAISIDIGPSVTSALAADLLGEVQLYQQVMTPPADSLAAGITELIHSLSDALSRQLPDAVFGLCGITLGIHGVTCNNEIIFAPLYPPEIKNLLFQLKHSFPVPFFLENEANLAVIGERAFLSPNYQNLVDISIHSGVGLGLLFGGRLYTGVSGYAGEFGHTIIEPGGRPCTCGQKGCLEQYLSEPALLEEYSSLSSIAAPTLSDFFSALRQKNASALAAADSYMNMLMLCISNICHAYNPELIIITSSLLKEFPELFDSRYEYLSPKKGGCPISISTLNEKSSLYGGIYKSIAAFLGIPSFSFPAETKHASSYSETQMIQR